MICGLCAEKAACETCCLLLTCWAESVHPQGTGACGSRLAGSIRHPGTHRVLLSLPKAAQQFMSSLLAAVQERSLGKELHSFEMRIKHSSGASWSKGIYDMIKVRRWHNSPGKEQVRSHNLPSCPCHGAPDPQIYPPRKEEAIRGTTFPDLSKALPRLEMPGLKKVICPTIS